MTGWVQVCPQGSRRTEWDALALLCPTRFIKCSDWQASLESLWHLVPHLQHLFSRHSKQWHSFKTETTVSMKYGLTFSRRKNVLKLQNRNKEAEPNKCMSLSRPSAVFLYHSLKQEDKFAGQAPCSAADIELSMTEQTHQPCRIPALPNGLKPLQNKQFPSIFCFAFYLKRKSGSHQETNHRSQLLNTVFQILCYYKELISLHMEQEINNPRGEK